MSEKAKKYKIVRFYRSGRKEIMQRFKTLEYVQEWCSREDTHKKGVWFDGYTEEK